MGKAQGIKTSTGYSLPPNYRERLSCFGNSYSDHVLEKHTRFGKAYFG
jgi:hypothetical protein